MRRFLVFFLIIFVCLNFAGYYPTFGIPPIKRAYVLAQEMSETGEIIPQSFSKPLSLPHPGYLSTKFSNYHPGIDIASGIGMPIHPIIDGVIEKIGRDFFGLGNYVVVSHEKGFKSKYAHMGKIYVKIGDKTTSENILGEVGMSGRTSGPHTHLEITLNDEYIDPQKLLPELQDIPSSPSASLAATKK